MDLIAYTPSLTPIRKDRLKDIHDYADYVCIFQEELKTAVNLFGKDKTYIIICFEEPDISQIQKLDLAKFIIQVPESFGPIHSYPFMYLEGANTWEQANHYARQGVAAVRFESPLTFSSEELRQWRGTFTDTLLFATADPNVQFLSSWFARPEDIHQYEDVFDALCVNPSNLRYYAQGSFRGNLNALLPSLPASESVSNQLLTPDFAIHRLNCKQVCENPSYGCFYCERIRGITKQMERIYNNGN